MTVIYRQQLANFSGDEKQKETSHALNNSKSARARGDERTWSIASARQRLANEQKPCATFRFDIYYTRRETCICIKSRPNNARCSIYIASQGCRRCILSAIAKFNLRLFCGDIPSVHRERSLHTRTHRCKDFRYSSCLDRSLADWICPVRSVYIYI